MKLECNQCLFYGDCWNFDYSRFEESYRCPNCGSYDIKEIWEVE